MGHRNRRRNSAKYLAIAGAIGGVGRVLESDAANRRQQRAQEFALKYRATEKAADRTYQEGQTAANQQFQQGLIETKNQNAIALLDKGREFNWNDPKLAETYSNVPEAKAAGDPSVLTPRTTTGSTSAASQNFDRYLTLNEEQQKVWDHVNKIKADSGGMTKAQRDKAGLDFYEGYTKLDRRSKKEALTGLGIDPAMEPREREKAVKKAYRNIVSEFAGQNSEPTGGAIGLLDKPTPSNSQDNPAIQQARDAIAQGADRNAVIQRLRGMGLSDAEIGLL